MLVQQEIEKQEADYSITLKHVEQLFAPIGSAHGSVVSAVITIRD